jgi:hypothetical protein
MTTKPLVFTDIQPVDSEPDKQATVLLDVSIRKPGKTRKADLGKIDAGDTEKTLLRLSKQLLDSDELRAIDTADNAFKQWLYTRAVPGAPFRAGIHVIPARLISEVDTKLAIYQANRERLIERFLLAYPQRIAEARERLGAQFKGTDYPPKEALKAAFRVDFSYFTFETPQSLAGISKELFDREKDKAREVWQQAQDDMREAMRACFAELVDHMRDRLKTADDGKPRIFRDSLVANLKDFLSTFPARDITNDGELAALCDRARSLLDGIEPDDLRKQEPLRENVRASMDEIKRDLDAAVTAASTRRRKFRL